MRLALLVAGSLKAGHPRYADAHAWDEGDVSAEPRMCCSRYPKICFYRRLHLPVSGNDL